MKKLFFSTGIFLLINAMAFAQGGKITFEKTIHDFGVIKEEGGPVSVEFKFTNTGTEPLIVSNVQPSCGCTTPGWTKEPVASGQSGVIKAEYNPRNRPGTFTKTLNVTSNGEPKTFTLTIKGTVTPKPKTIKDELPDSIGNIRLQSRYLNLGKVTTEKPFTKEFALYNSGTKPITFKDEKTVPAHIKVSIEPKTIQPKERAIMMITYDAKAKNDYGFITDPLVINTNEEVNGTKSLHVSAQIEEYFPPMTPSELEKAPKITFEKTEYDFGVVKPGISVSTDFKFTNTGKSDLIIRKTKANCGCTASEPDKKVLKPGES
ncbi:MAG TPA: DUF1573 domain-containing protein, partial [Cytophagales bacterium]|nr:DUF1573 domain-containing protein [Cytophagales bacterium]